MRIAIAEIVQETDSFSPITATRDDFAAYGLYVGDEILARMPGVGPLGGFLEVAAEQPAPVTVLPLIRAFGGAGGTITAETLRYLTESLVSRLRSALPLDAVFLSLHGAAAAENEDDVEGHLLAAVRAVVGAELPVVVAFDHHANVTTRMMRHADLLVGHETQPHDPPATGRKAARLLFRWLRGEIRPARAWRKIPLITPQDQFLTSSGPMREWFAAARRWEQQPGVLDVSPYPMQPWLDVAEGGWSVVVHVDGNTNAEAIAAEMAELVWRLRDEFWKSDRVAIPDAVRQGVATSQCENGLVLLSDTGDSVYGGAPGDNTTLLRELLEQRVPVRALVPVVDPVALEAAIAAGTGSEVTLSIGGRLDSKFSQPVPVTAKVAAVSLGTTIDLADRGVCNLQRTALLAVGEVRIALLGHRSFAVNHPVLYTHLGVDLDDARLVVLKTASNFQFFAKWRRGLIRVDTPGTTQSDLTAFEWRRLPRPTYPLQK